MQTLTQVMAHDFMSKIEDDFPCFRHQPRESQEDTGKRCGPDIIGERKMWCAAIRYAIEEYQYDPMSLSDPYQQRVKSIQKALSRHWLFKSKRCWEGSLNYICENYNISKDAVRKLAGS